MFSYLQKFYIHVIHIISQITQAHKIYYLFKQLFPHFFVYFTLALAMYLITPVGDIDILLDSP